MPTAALTVCLIPRCPHPAVDRGRCAMHRQTTSQRGYNITHQRARQDLRATLPGPCGYGCGTTLMPDGDWVAAHVVDGQPQYGWLASCRTCNERAKKRYQTRGMGVRISDRFVLNADLPPFCERKS